MKSPRQTLLLNLSGRYAIIALALLLSACGVFPQQNEPRNEPTFTRVDGVVNYVDTANNKIEMTTDRNSKIAPGQRIALNYSDRTIVEFEGNNYRPQDLEQGDRIVADVDGDLRYLSVSAIQVIEDSSSDGQFAADNLYISGTLRQIDKRNKKLIVDTSDRGREVQVRFNNRTRVLLDGRSIAVSELREYDQLNIELTPGERNALADTITVVDDQYPAQNNSQVAIARGQVVAVDENRREIVISTADRFVQSFDTREDDQVTFLYETEMSVEYQGKSYSPSNLERGDMVEVDYERVGNELWAKKVVVTSNVRD